MIYTLIYKGIYRRILCEWNSPLSWEKCIEKLNEIPETRKDIMIYFSREFNIFFIQLFTYTVKYKYILHWMIKYWIDDLLLANWNIFVSTFSFNRNLVNSISYSVVQYCWHIPKCYTCSWHVTYCTLCKIFRVSDSKGQTKPRV